MNQIPLEKFKPIPAGEKDSEFLARPKITYWSDAWRRFKQNKIALAALIMLAVLIFMVAFGPILSSHDFEKGVRTDRNLSPSATYWFGTDELGRDIFARIWVSGRVSIIIGLVGAFISMVVGSVYGAISAYAGGALDNLMMRIVEVLSSVPYLLVVILIQVYFKERNLATMIFALTLTGWLGMARMVRGQLLSLKNQDFVMAAQTLGVSSRKIILRHLIPNTLSVIIVSVTFAIPGYIFSEAFLSYLGIGIASPMTSWGAMASAAQQKFLFYPYQLFFPSLMIALTMLSFTLLGDGLRDALDPRLRQ
ncbi:MAG: ABC transporter permease [Clostridium sp.]|nr:ABC transporter permease [Clostridium sp.]